MMTCIAIDDEPLALAVIKKYLADTPQVQLINSFTDAIPVSYTHLTLPTTERV